jgi:uncharacterized SAM-binding protein YcdF (DUF218 family)
VNIRRLRRIIITVLIFLLAWIGLAWIAAKALIVESELPQADALVVLSGSGNYIERTRAAAELFKAGRAQKIILTNDNERGGWSSAEERNPFFEELEFAELVRAGVPAEKIEGLTEIVTSTYDEAVLVREYASAQGLHSIMVVTSPYHSRRALWTWRRVFQNSGIEIGLSAAPTGEQSPNPFSWWWHPRGWAMVAGEYPKLIYYWLQYH